MVNTYTQAHLKVSLVSTRRTWGVSFVEVPVVSSRRAERAGGDGKGVRVAVGVTRGFDSYRARPSPPLQVPIPVDRPLRLRRRHCPRSTVARENVGPTRPRLVSMRS